MSVLFHELETMAKGVISHMPQAMHMVNLIKRSVSEQYAAPGATITLPKAPRFRAVDGIQYQGGNAEELVEQFTVADYVHVDLDMTVPDVINVLDRWRGGKDYKGALNELMASMATALSARVETKLMQEYYRIYNFSGTPGSKPSAYADFAAAKNILRNNGYGAGNFYGVIEPEVASAISQFVLNLNNPPDVGKTLRDSYSGMVDGISLYNSSYIITHQVGNWGGSGAVNGAQSTTFNDVKIDYSQNLATDGWNASVTGLLKKGDVINIAGVYALHRDNYASTGRLQDFTILEDVNSDGSGNATLKICPPIITSGQNQTVSVGAADNAAITVKTGAANSLHKQNVVFARDAFVMQARKFILPSAVMAKTQYAVSDSKTGLALTATGQYNATTVGQVPTDAMRLDFVFGKKCVAPEMAVRITS